MECNYIPKKLIQLYCINGMQSYIKKIKSNNIIYWGV